MMMNKFSDWSIACDLVYRCPLLGTDRQRAVPGRRAATDRRRAAWRRRPRRRRLRVGPQPTRLRHFRYHVLEAGGRPRANARRVTHLPT